MKIKSALYLLLIILLATFLSTTVAAEEEILDWPTSVETNEITVIQGGDSIYYRYIPSETREYAIIYQNWVPLHYEIHAADGGFLDYRNWMDDNNHCYDIYTFTAGEEYIITFFYGGEPSPEGKYTGKITIAPWEDKLIIPDYPYIQENEKITVTLSNDECVYYLFSPAQSGTYCVGKNTSNVLVNIGPVPQKPNDDPHYPDNLGDWFTDNQQGSLYHLESGNLYLICIQEFTIPHGSSTITDTVWIRQGEAPKNEYPVWNMRDAKTVTLKSEEVVKYYITPAETGRYVMLRDGCIAIHIYDDENILDDQFSTSDGKQGYVFDLIAGKQYVISLQEWGSFSDSVTGTFKFEKVGAVKSASIYVANFGSDHYILGLDTDPICGHLEGVTWSVSNPSAFPVIHQSDTGIELEIRGSGTTTVTAKVGSVTASIELSSDPKLPVLKEGETMNLTIGGTAAEFTPTKSGKYQFTVNPDRDNMYFSVFTETSDDPIYMKEEFSSKLTFTMTLNAGQKYELVQLFGKSTVSVKYAGGSSSQETTIPPTQPIATAPATTPPETTEPTDTTESTQITAPDSTQAASTEPTADGNEDVHIGDSFITADDITTEDLIKFENTENTTFQISADALRLAAEQGSSLSLDFPYNVNVILYNNILRTLSADTTGEYISINVTPQTYYDLNEAQQESLDGKSLVWLLDMTLTFDGNSIHELGGNAQITLPNPDSNKDWQILYLAEDGTVELLDITGEENISFTTDHFSKYALVFAEKTDADHGNLILWISISIVLLLIGGGTAAFFIIKKKKK